MEPKNNLSTLKCIHIKKIFCLVTALAIINCSLAQVRQDGIGLLVGVSQLHSADSNKKAVNQANKPVDSVAVKKETQKTKPIPQVPKGLFEANSLQADSGTKFSKMLAGTLVAGGSAAQFKIVTITFPTAFIGTPKITVTPRNDPANINNDVYAVTVRSISATAAVINILRVDVAAGWGQNMQLDWQAWTQ
jgi:hypothetical protein